MLNIQRLKFMWQALLGYTWFVIIWGAFVRASGSGDGCGKNWPTCHGQLIPESSNIATWVEYIHRTSSGLFGIFVLLCVLAAWKLLLKKTKNKSFFYKLEFWFPFLVLIFTLIEALIGAQLVLSGLVGSNASWARALIMVVHLVNTFLLVACIQATRHFIQAPQSFEKASAWNPYVFGFNALGLFIVASLGAITALGDTLYPSQSFAHGLHKDLDHTTPFLLRLRVLHPLIATLVTLSVCRMALSSLEQKYSKYLIFWMASTLVIGLVNLALLAPIFMQLLHLLWAQILWAKFCTFGCKNINVFHNQNNLMN